MKKIKGIILVALTAAALLALMWFNCNPLLDENLQTDSISQSKIMEETDVVRASGYTPPSNVFNNLSNYKLQRDGHSDQSNLQGYADEHFYLDSSNYMCFQTDSAQYDRSELRGLTEFTKNSVHEQVVQMKMESTAADRVTVCQIHGGNDVGNPLVKMQWKTDGHLYALIKNNGAATSEYPAVDCGSVGYNLFTVSLKMNNGSLVIKVNGSTKWNESLSYWTSTTNYFKVGAYQQTSGASLTRVKSLSVY